MPSSHLADAVCHHTCIGNSAGEGGWKKKRIESLMQYGYKLKNVVDTDDVEQRGRLTMSTSRSEKNDGEMAKTKRVAMWPLVSGVALRIVTPRRDLV